jgi:hypothetical protein
MDRGGSRSSATIWWCLSLDLTQTGLAELPNRKMNSAKATMIAASNRPTNTLMISALHGHSVTITKLTQYPRPR